MRCHVTLKISERDRKGRHFHMALVLYTRRTAHFSSQLALPSLIAGKENALQLVVVSLIIFGAGIVTSWSLVQQLIYRWRCRNSKCNCVLHYKPLRREFYTKFKMEESRISCSFVLFRKESDWWVYIYFSISRRANSQTCNWTFICWREQQSTCKLEFAQNWQCGVRISRPALWCSQRACSSRKHYFHDCAISLYSESQVQGGL